MRFIFLSLLSFGLFCKLSAQQILPCVTDEVYRQNCVKYPGYEQVVKAAFDYAKQQQASSKQSSTFDTIYRIPVVVHVVYDSAKQNIPDSVIFSQIKVLNQDYRRKNDDTSDTRSIFSSRAGDAGIEFFLADTDPNGNATNGITRTNTTKDNFSFDLFGGGLGIDAVKFDTSGGINAWDVNKYMNIWVCNTEASGFSFGLVLGLAYPPVGAPNWPAGANAPDPGMEGVVIHYKVFGRNNIYSNTGSLVVAGEGRTPVHEAGHFLGLRHIWGDANAFIGEDGCTVDDGIDDTPNCKDNAAQSCNLNKNTCTDPVGDTPDMIENYMDYSDERCMNMFSEGQIAIMRSTLATLRTQLPNIGSDNDNPLVLSEGEVVYINGIAYTITDTAVVEFGVGDTLIYNGLNGQVMVLNSTASAYGLNALDELEANGNEFSLNDEAVGVVVQSVGIAEHTIEGLNIYPNPGNGFINLTYTLAKEAEVELTITDMLGKTERIAPSQAKAGINHLLLDMANKPAGIYTIRIASEGTVLSKKLSVF
ncbi:MAG: M43 family zinc metalloprotease [Chitinophagales bacterium]|nr:M43 family zinc metalloprotease [Chitinophagales bacterium]